MQIFSFFFPKGNKWTWCTRNCHLKIADSPFTCSTNILQRQFETVKVCNKLKVKVQREHSGIIICLNKLLEHQFLLKLKSYKIKNNQAGRYIIMQVKFRKARSARFALYCVWSGDRLYAVGIRKHIGLAKIWSHRHKA